MELSENRRQAIEAELAKAGVPLGERTRFSCFGNTPELAAELGALVARGKKRATASQNGVYAYYELDRPEVGDIEVICDFVGSLLAVIEIMDLRVVSFGEVDGDFARLEGEGDGSLGHWRRVHREYFEAECKAMGVLFSEGVLRSLSTIQARVCPTELGRKHEPHPTDIRFRSAPKR